MDIRAELEVNHVKNSAGSLNTGTSFGIFMLRITPQRIIQIQKDMCLCFTDYSKAFDKLRHKDLLEILCHCDISGKNIRIDNL